MKYRPLPSVERLNELFVYEPITGVLMRRMKGGMLNLCNSPLVRKYDDGSVRTIYNQVPADKTNYLVHRIAYKMYHGVDPLDLQVDHIDGCGLNNRIANLRLATRSQNGANSFSKNYRRHHRSGKYEVQVMFDGICHYGGLFELEEDAKVAAKALKKKLHGEFARV